MIGKHPFRLISGKQQKLNYNPIFLLYPMSRCNRYRFRETDEFIQSVIPWISHQRCNLNSIYSACFQQRQVIKVMKKCGADEAFISEHLLHKCVNLYWISGNTSFHKYGFSCFCEDILIYFRHTALQLFQFWRHMFPP